MSNPTMNIRIGTLVSGNGNAPDYIRQIKSHGFESFAITFWQKLGGVNLKELALKVKEVIAYRCGKVSRQHVPWQSG